VPLCFGESGTLTVFLVSLACIFNSTGAPGIFLIG